jgi:hypothetical protein
VLRRTATLFCTQHTCSNTMATRGRPQSGSPGPMAEAAHPATSLFPTLAAAHLPWWTPMAPSCSPRPDIAIRCYPFYALLRLAPIHWLAPPLVCSKCGSVPPMYTSSLALGPVTHAGVLMLFSYPVLIPAHTMRILQHCSPSSLYLQLDGSVLRY